jgi:hypothetical protein
VYKFLLHLRCQNFAGNVALKAQVHVYWHCLRQAPVKDRYYVNNNNVVPLHSVRLPTNFHTIWRLFTVQATMGYIHLSINKLSIIHCVLHLDPPKIECNI